jgi:hypothetical protein
MKTTTFSTFTRRMTTVTLLGIAALAMGMFGSNSASAFTTNLVASQVAWIDSNLPNTIRGPGELRIFNNPPTETWRGLMSFDLSFLTGATVTSAVLKLGVPITFWTEAGQNVNRLRTDFVENQLTWNSNSSSSAWATPGGLGATDSTNIATGIVGGNGSTPWANGGLNVTSVASNWFISPDTTQLGFMVYFLPAAGVDAVRYNSPVLEISSVPEPAVVGLIGLGGLLAGFARFRRRA